MILFHGTTEESAQEIMKEGFVYGRKYNWKGSVKSKKGFIYLSSAYAPYYAMMAESNSNNRALIKVSVDSHNLYPDEDFITYAFKIPQYRINLEDYKKLANNSLLSLGNVAVKPEKIKMVGIRFFDSKNLIFVCDPIINPINYKFMGKYYKELTIWIYNGNKPLDFNKKLLEL